MAVANPCTSLKCSSSTASGSELCVSSSSYIPSFCFLFRLRLRYNSHPLFRRSGFSLGSKLLPAPMVPKAIVLPANRGLPRSSFPSSIGVLLILLSIVCPALLMPPGISYQVPSWIVCFFTLASVALLVAKQIVSCAAEENGVLRPTGG